MTQSTLFATPPRPRFRLKTVSVRPTENEVERDVLRFLTARGWWAERNHVGLFHPIGSKAVLQIGDEGKPDWTFHRPRRGPLLGGIIWAELKRPRETPVRSSSNISASSRR